MERDLTQGSVLKTLLNFSLPFLLSYFLQTLYGMADLFIIGQFCSVDSTTAVSLGSQVMHMVTVMIVGLAMGGTVMIGRAVGARDRERTFSCVGNTITLFLIVAAALTALLVCLVRPVVWLLSTPEQAQRGTAAYLTVCFLGIPFITAYNILSSIFRGLGDSKSPMYFVAVACAVNIGLDYLFIGAFHMDSAGAALATVAAQAVSVVTALAVILQKKSDLRLKKSHFALKRDVVSGLLKIGVPVAVQDGFVQVAFIVITVIVNQRGLNDAAAVGIVEKMISVLFLVPSSMLSSISALAAQNVGAKKHGRARLTLRYGIIIAAGWGLLCVAVMQLFAEPFVGLFTSSGLVAKMGAEYLRGYVFDCVFAGIHFCFSGYFCACGKSGYSFLHNVISIVFARIPLAFLASKLFEQTLFPMGIATALGSLLSVLVCAALYVNMKKKNEYV